MQIMMIYKCQISGIREVERGLMGKPMMQPSPLMHPTVQRALSSMRLHDNRSQQTVNLLGGGFSAEVRGQLRIIYICRAVHLVKTDLSATNVQECEIIRS